MNIKIIDKVGLKEDVLLLLIQSLLRNRAPKEGSFDYGFETHGAIGLMMNDEIKHPVQVWQTNKRKNEKSPIEITIEKHTPIF